MRGERKRPQPLSAAAEGQTSLVAPKAEPLDTLTLGDGIHKVTIESQIQAFEQAGVIALRAEWRRLFGNDPPRLSRDLLVRALAYRVQERALGGLSRASLKRLRELAEDPEGLQSPPERPASLRSGMKLVREWHGRTHLVIVTENGFDYAGSSYKSLTQIAKLITGAHWSGPRFFGLVTRGDSQERANG